MAPRRNPGDLSWEHEENDPRRDAVVPALRGADFSADAVGATGASFLRIGAGARAVAMGGAFSAVADDASAVYLTSSPSKKRNGFDIRQTGSRN